MGIKSTIKGWFSRKSKAIEVNQPNSLGNLNGLYVPNKGDITKIATKLNEVEDALNNLPPPPNLDNYAKKDVDNNFSTPQSIQGGSSFIAFKNNAGNRVGYIGKGSSTTNDIDLNAENGNLTLKATRTITVNQAPTANNSVATKKYVDDNVNVVSNNITTSNASTLQEAKSYTDGEIAKVPQPDLTNIPKLDTNNSFKGTTNSFQTIGAVAIDADNAIIRHNLRYSGQTTLGDNVVTKSYVDSKIGALCNYKDLWFDGVELQKVDVVSNTLWAYKIYRNSSTINFNFGTEFANKRVIYQIFIIRLINNETYIGVVNNYGELTVSATGYGGLRLRGNSNWFLSASDFKPGAGGEFTKDVLTTVYYWTKGY